MTLDELYQRSDPWHGTTIGALWRAKRTWRPVQHVTTGFAEVDDRMGGGLRTGGVHAFGGKTGQAKSQLAVQVSVNAAKAGVPVGFLSLELGTDEVAQLIVAGLADVPRLALATGELDKRQGERLREATAHHGEMPLTILDDDFWERGLTRESLETVIATGAQRFQWKLVVLDYLGLLLPSPDDRDQYDTDIRHSTALKRIARKYDIALLVVAAVRKGATSRESGELTIDDLMGAGRLVYDAQSVLLVSRELEKTNSGIVKVRPLKLRFAPCDESSNVVRLRWKPSTGLITDLRRNRS